jgi:hypothetical protein
MILRILLAAGLAASIVSSAAAQATADQKRETCEFGANDKKLKGAARKSFMAKCMSDKDSPRGKAVGAPARQ